MIRVRQNNGRMGGREDGCQSRQLIEVFGDLHEGDEVATRGTDQLRAGTEVSPRLVSSK